LFFGGNFCFPLIVGGGGGGVCLWVLSVLGCFLGCVVGVGGCVFGCAFGGLFLGFLGFVLVGWCWFIPVPS